MIQWLSIKNLALIEDAEIEFSEGFNVITGETGAGKSVLISAVSLLLGERAGKGLIRSGARRCELSASIFVPRACRPRIADMLNGADVPVSGDDSLLLRRVITPSSSRHYVNDSSVTQDTLRRLGELLVDMHGPHEHQSLLRPAEQMGILDRYGNTGKLVRDCGAAWEGLRAVLEEKEEMEDDLPNESEAGYLRSVLREIRGIDPKPGEDEELSRKHRLVAGSRDLLRDIKKCALLLNESETSIVDQLGGIRKTIDAYRELDEKLLVPLIKDCDRISESIVELARNLDDYGEGLDLDENEFQRLEERLGAVHALKRRYGPGLEKVLETADRAKNRLEQYDNFEEKRKKLEAEEKKSRENLEKCCSKLSAARAGTAGSFKKSVEKEIEKLGLENSVFDVDIGVSEPGPEGADKLEFMFSANPGDAPRPLRSVASSGEISRLMLALKTVLAGADEVPILVFDEIDVNIGGKTAGIVGGELKKLGQTRQVLCISHLAQVAAGAERHFSVDKKVSGGRAKTVIRALTGKERKTELGRMLGGGDAALSHAAELAKKP